MIFFGDGEVMVDKDRVITYLLYRGWRRNLEYEGFFTDPTDRVLSYYWEKCLDMQKQRDLKRGLEKEK